jgi:transposase-like protein
MYQNGLGSRSIERYTGISHNTIINWVRQAQSNAMEASAEEGDVVEAIGRVS